MNKKAFSIIELMVVVLIIGTGLIGVFTMISNSYTFLTDIKSKLTAVNIARGGIESVFNIRNTNWQRWGGKKDKCWLKVNPLVDNSNDGCENDTWFGSGSYKLSLTGVNQKYPLLTLQSQMLKTDGSITSTDWNYLLCKENGTISPCTGPITGRPNDYFAPELYFQQVRGGYLLDKDANNEMTNCPDGVSNPDCSDGRFLEKNFCVDVVYFAGAKKNVTFCSVMTNFQE